jgi:hypothetical protein
MEDSLSVKMFKMGNLRIIKIIYMKYTCAPVLNP